LSLISVCPTLALTLAAADAAWAKLPKAEQDAWTRSKLRYHPNVVRFLAAVGERLKGRAGG
jgi:hypothetical protein